MGIDLSLTRTGLVVVRDGKVVRHVSIKTNSKDVEEVRFQAIVMVVMATAREQKPLVTAIESAIGGRTQHITHGLNAVVRWELFRGGFLFDTIAPNSLKKVATGNGKAEKEEMVAAAQVLWPGCPNHDEADAFHAAMWATTLDVQPV